MLTFVFLAFIAAFAVAGIFISLSARKRRDGATTRPTMVAGDSPTVGRATSGKD